MEKYQSNVQNRKGDAVSGASVRVLTYPGNVLATIYSDDGVTPAANPLTTDSNGAFFFYAADGQYSLQISGNGIAPLTISDVALGPTPITIVGDLSNTSDATKGDALLGVKQPLTGSAAQTQHDKNFQNVSVKDFVGADDSARAQAMISAVGYARFTRGEYTMTTATLDAPLFFDPGAFLNVGIGNTLTITNSIESPRQFIFQGSGSYLLRNDSDSGEDVHQVHASWFGAFPDNNAEEDQAPMIAKLLASLDNTRESIVQFDSGRYSIGSGLSVPRATAIKGMGTRRTVFSALGNGYDLFTPLANGCRFEDIQFELSDSFPTTYRTSGAWILVSQQLCEIYNVWLGQANSSIVVTAGQCRLFNISATYNVDLDAGSSLISVQSSDVSIDHVMVASGDVGPDYIIEIGGASPNNITGVSVSDVGWTNPSIGVSVSANSRILGGINIEGLRYRGTAAAPYVAELLTTGTGIIGDVVVTDVVTNSLATNGFSIRQGSSGSISRISFNNIKCPGTSGRGFEFIQTAGTISNITVGDTVYVSSFATPYFYSGTMGAGIVVSALADTVTNQAKCFDFTIADDSVSQINLNRTSVFFTGALILTVGVIEYAILATRPANTPNVASMLASANVNTSTVALTGTTGTDGKFTVGVTNGILYFENRLGSSQRVSVSLLYGIK